MRRVRTAVSVVLAMNVSGSLGAAHGHETKVGDLVVDHPWSRATPPSAKVASGYLSIRNESSSPDRLLSVSSIIAGRAQVHETSMADGIARMRPVQGGLEIKPGESVELKPGSPFHIMFEDLRQGLKPRDRFPATLLFERSGAIEVVFQVNAVAGAEPAHDGVDHGSAGQPSR